jgi:Ca-activated chloride channel homolog
MKRVLFVLLFLVGDPTVAPAADWLSRPMKEVDEGNAQFGDKHYQQALEHYEEAEEVLNQEPRIHFDRGAALLMLDRHKEAREAFLHAVGTRDPGLKKNNFYNIGNTFLSEQLFPEAISYYRRALEIDPNYDDARFNLELAIRAIEQKDKQSSKDSKKDPKEDQKKDPKQDQNKENQQNQQDKQGDKQEDKQKDKQGQENPQTGESKQGNPDQEKNKSDNSEKQKQEKADQQNQQPQKQSQESDEQNQQPDQGKKEESNPQEKKDSGRLSKNQVRDLLDSMRENEKPFQLFRFVLPEFKRQAKNVEKDW